MSQVLRLSRLHMEANEAEQQHIPSGLPETPQAILDALLL